jgi:hypothetical protein
VRVEDVGVLRAEELSGAPPDGEELTARQAHGGVEAPNLAPHVRRFERGAVDVLRLRAAAHAQDAPRRRAVRDADAPPQLLAPAVLPATAHASSPNLSSIKRHTASTARSSSVPSAVTFNSVPRAAASISTLRIDLASADAPPSAR